ncbi:putative geranyl diphosphate diphosphatase [Medicago truncatula]|uniref:Putative geranyl diphosphate diphosphatase n=1 Tax=Medicago truncatula TaxID=3880 RepID=A0RZI3_MEDTR|nr:probable terpene synthase 11 [Medicago truncatula]ABB01626.1 terpene synthase [Medicago truncatula]AES67304.1 sesquiterpene synthase [Medicago truncatula]RHN75610.1 putative geranyl diphosphate diphosphatase [Medicago truncatula]
MAFTELRVSYLTSTLARCNFGTSTYQSRILSLQKSSSRIMHSKLSIKSIALNEKLSPLQTEDKTKSLGQVKRRSREALVNSNDPIVTLKMIDSIQRLGIGHHLEDEINIQLGRICDWDLSQDLFATSLQFRLLRHNGWTTCSDVFRKFLDKSGNFNESLTKDVWGMLSLYEASYLGTEDEEILKKAMEFSRARLSELIPHLSPEVGRNIAKSLTLPKHLRMARLEARNYMEEYSKGSNQIPALLELAKLDSDMVQSLHQRELAEICRWWKELGLVEKLGFARDRPTECFLWTVGIFPEPCHSNCRIELTKTICILLVMDDIFDTYGTLDELVLFTKAIKRWDLDAMDQLPEYMKICYMALYNTTNEIAYKIQKEHGLTVVSYLKRTWIDIFEAFLEEAKWFNNGCVPNFKTYLDNGVISAGSCMALVHATFLIGDGLSKETMSIMMKSYPRLFTCSGEILRLWDDLGTSTEEQERGDNASSIQCMMRENNISDENEGRIHIRMLLGNLWRELNGLATTKTIPLSVVKASLNMARTAQVIYQHGDDQSTFTVDDYVQTLIFTSLPTSH